VLQREPKARARVCVSNGRKLQGSLSLTDVSSLKAVSVLTPTVYRCEARHCQQSAHRGVPRGTHTNLFRRICRVPTQACADSPANEIGGVFDFSEGEREVWDTFLGRAPIIINITLT